MILKDKNCQSKIFFSAKLSFKYENMQNGLIGKSGKANTFKWKRIQVLQMIEVENIEKMIEDSTSATCTDCNK